MAIFDRIAALLTHSSRYMKLNYQRIIALSLISFILTGCFRPDSPQDVAREFWKSVITQQVDNVIQYSTLVDAKSYDSFNKKWDGKEWQTIAKEGEE